MSFSPRLDELVENHGMSDLIWPTAPEHVLVNAIESKAFYARCMVSLKCGLAEFADR